MFRVISLTILVGLVGACGGPKALEPTTRGSQGGNTGGGDVEEGGGGSGPGGGGEIPEPQKILYVNGSTDEDGNGTTNAPFKSIQSALNIAKKGTEVRIAAGQYNENLTIKNGVVLRGGFAPSSYDVAKPGEFKTLINDSRSVGGESLTAPAAAINISARDELVIIQDLEVRGATVDQDSPSANQWDEVSVGINIADSRNVTIQNTIVSGGSSGFYTVAILAMQSSVNLFKNVIDGGKGHTSYGVYFTGDTSAKVTQNQVNGGSAVSASLGIVSYESGNSHYSKNYVVAGAGIENCFGIRASTPTTGLKAFYNNIVDDSECTGSLIGLEIWGNTLRSGNVVVRNNSISVMDGSSSNSNLVVRLLSLYDASVELSNNIFHGDRRTTESTCIREADINSHPRMLRNNNFSNCNFLYYRFTNSGGTTLNTIASIEATPENNAFGNAAIEMTFAGLMKPASGSDVKILQGAVNGATEQWSETTDYLGKVRTGNELAKGWSMGAYEIDSK